MGICLLMKKNTYLISHGSGNVGVGTHGGKEDAEVAHGVVGGPADKRKTNEAKDGVEDNDR